MFHPRRIILFLLLGAVVNILVAWASSRWGDVDKCKSLVHQSKPQPLQPHEIPSRVSKWIGDPIAWGNRGWEADPVSRARMGRWCTVRRFESGVPMGRDYECVDLGFPLRSMTCEAVAMMERLPIAGMHEWCRVETQAEGVYGGWLPSYASGQVPLGTIIRGATPLVTYPLVPLPLGFTINTLFYAALLYLPFATFTTLRRRRRIRLNLCPSCGYNLTGATPQNNTITCPECGRRSA